MLDVSRIIELILERPSQFKFKDLSQQLFSESPSANVLVLVKYGIRDKRVIRIL
jgi:hypothetical protein